MDTRQALILGGTDGIGLATAINLQASGYDVITCGRRETGCNAAAEILGKDALVLKGDVRIPGDVDRIYDAVNERWGGLDILIHSFGGDGTIKPCLEIDDQQWQSDFEENFFAVVRTDRKFIPLMITQEYGSIVYVSSIAAVQPSYEFLPYCAAKAALLTYCSGMARQMVASRVNCNAILPGFVETQQMRRVEAILAEQTGSSPEETKNSIVADIPIGEYVTPEDVANTISFLVSDKARHIVGTQIVLDGGVLNG